MRTPSKPLISRVRTNAKPVWVWLWRPQARAGAFTLVELLVVVAIIALLLAIMVPSLSKARAHAKAAVCAAQMRSMSAGLATYTTQFDGWLPGMNTSGVAMLAKFMDTITAEALRDPNLPVQPHDWATPILRMGMSLPASRAEKLRLVTEKHQCPSQGTIKSVLYPSDDNGIPNRDRVPDTDDFLTQASWTALSYLMPAHFQYWGRDHKKVVLAWSEGSGLRKAVRPKTTPDDWEALYDGFVSHLDYVGTPARKVFLADGTRYLTAEGILDHDISPDPDKFGSFTSSGAWWTGSTAYGVASDSANWAGNPVDRGSPSNGRNLKLSYRHSRSSVRTPTTCADNRGAINAVFFDGHVELLNDQRSRQIDLWYPSGAVVQFTNQGMTRVPEGYVVP